MSDWILYPNKLYLEDTRKYCFLPYQNHPKGCPNCYGKCWGDNKTQPRVDEVMNLSRPYYFVYSRFDLEKHAANMKSKHPSWSDRQCKCVLYWQGTARKRLREHVREALTQINPTPDYLTYLPELHGVNVYESCRDAGLVLDSIAGMRICTHIALLGYGPEGTRGATAELAQTRLDL